MAPTTPPLAPLPDLTPVPAVLRALADVGEVDLVKGLGQRRLAEVVRRTGPLETPRRASWLRLVWLLAAAVCVLLLALGR